MVPRRLASFLPARSAGRLMPRALCPEESKELAPAGKEDCWFLLPSEVGPDTHVQEEKQCGEQAQPQLWGARPRPLSVEKDTRSGRGKSEGPE